MKIRFKMFDKSEAVLFIFLILFLWEPFKNSNLIYIVLGVFLIAGFIKQKCCFHIHFDFEAKCSVILVLIWVYGIMMGFIMHNEIQYIFRNFAGMTFYSIYILIDSKGINSKSIKTVLYSLSIITVLATMAVYCDQFLLGTEMLGNVPLFNNYVMTSSVENVIYFPTREMIGISYLHSIYSLFILNRRKIGYFLIAVADILTTVICIKSAGDILGLIILTFLFAVSFISIHIKERIYLYITIIIGIILVGLTSFVLFGEVLFGSFFSETSSGNSIRYHQIRYFLDFKNFKITGHGLGAPVEVLREKERPYAVEVIYLNLFHKFGIAAFGIIYIYLRNCIDAVKILMSKRINVENIYPIACMAYLVTALGNPLLFSSTTVTLHVCAMVIINKYKKESNNDRKEKVVKTRYRI